MTITEERPVLDPGENDPIDAGSAQVAPGSALWRVVLWVLALVSFAAAAGTSLYLALGTYEVDLGVYLRLGGKYAFSPYLYSAVFGNTNLFFTYPPFAAVVFAPVERIFTQTDVVQTIWTAGNLAALVGLIAFSIKVVRPQLPRSRVWRLALGLSLPAMLLNPVFVTIGFGQVNLIVILLVMWDLLGPRKIFGRQVPLGIATGIAVAVKLTPGIFIPYMILTRRYRGAANCVASFVFCELVAFMLSPSSSIVYWTKDLFDPSRAGGLAFISNQDASSVLERFHHAAVPGIVVVPIVAAFAIGGLWLAKIAHERSSPMLGVLVCATTCLIISPVTWVHHMVWVVPAIIWFAMAEDRPRRGLLIAVATAVLFWIAPIWWVPNNDLFELHLNRWQLVAGNSFFFAMVIFLGGIGLLLWRRHLAEPQQRLVPAAAAPERDRGR